MSAMTENVSCFLTSVTGSIAARHMSAASSGRSTGSTQTTDLVGTRRREQFMTHTVQGKSWAGPVGTRENKMTQHQAGAGAAEAAAGATLAGVAGSAAATGALAAAGGGSIVAGGAGMIGGVSTIARAAATSAAVPVVGWVVCGAIVVGVGSWAAYRYGKCMYLRRRTVA